MFNNHILLQLIWNVSSISQYFLSMFLKNSASFSRSSMRCVSLSFSSTSVLFKFSISFSFLCKLSFSAAIFFWLFRSKSSNCLRSLSLVSDSFFSKSFRLEISFKNWFFCYSPFSINVDKSSLAFLSSCVNSTFLLASSSFWFLIIFSCSYSCLFLSVMSFLD